MWCRGDARDLFNETSHNDLAARGLRWSDIEERDTIISRRKKVSPRIDSKTTVDVSIMKREKKRKRLLYVCNNKQTC